MSGRYAEGTGVSPESSQQEIQRQLKRYGAEGFMFGWDGDRAVVAFKAHGRQVRFTMVMPTDPEKFKYAGTSRRLRTPAARKAALEAETRRLWRSLALAIKAKLEAVESGIVAFEDEFMAHIVLPSGRSVADEVLPAIAQAYETGGHMPLALEGGRR